MSFFTPAPSSALDPSFSSINPFGLTPEIQQTRNNSSGDPSVTQLFGTAGAFGSSMPFGGISPFNTANRAPSDQTEEISWDLHTLSSFGKKYEAPAFGVPCNSHFGRSTTGSSYFGQPSVPHCSNPFAINRAGVGPLSNENSSTIASNPFQKSQQPTFSDIPPPKTSFLNFPDIRSRVASYATTTEVEGEYSGQLSSISAMPMYSNKSHEELRLENYQSANKDASPLFSSSTPCGSAYGIQQTSKSSGDPSVLQLFGTGESQATSSASILAPSGNSVPFGGSSAFNAANRAPSDQTQEISPGFPTLPSFKKKYEVPAFGVPSLFGSPSTRQPSVSFGVSGTSVFDQPTADFSFYSHFPNAFAMKRAGVGPLSNENSSTIAPIPFLKAQQPTISNKFSPRTSFLSSHDAGSREASYAATTQVEGEYSRQLLSISAMQVYSNKSHEELRFEDYRSANKGRHNFGFHCVPQFFGTAGPFGATSSASVLAPAFGTATSFAGTSDFTSVNNAPSNQTQEISPGLYSFGQPEVSVSGEEGSPQLLKSSAFEKSVFNFNQKGSATLGKDSITPDDQIQSVCGMHPDKDKSTNEVFSIIASTPSPKSQEPTIPNILSHKTSFLSSPSAGSRVAPYDAITEVEVEKVEIEYLRQLSSISGMPVYFNKSHEELRLEDYQSANRDGPGPSQKSASGVRVVTSISKMKPFESSSEDMSCSRIIQGVGQLNINCQLSETLPAVQVSIQHLDSATSVQYGMSSVPVSDKSALVKQQSSLIIRHSPSVDSMHGGQEVGDNCGKPPEKNNSAQLKPCFQVSLEDIDEDVDAIIPKLQRADYYTVPSIQELASKEKEEADFCCHVKDFVVGRHGYGSIKFLGETDVRNLDLDSIIHFNSREVIVYMDESKKPAVGRGLNKPAEVTLLNVRCINKSSGKEYEDGPMVEKYRDILIKKAEEHGAEFVSYDAVEGEWKFKISHF